MQQSTTFILNILVESSGSLENFPSTILEIFSSAADLEENDKHTLEHYILSYLTRHRLKISLAHICLVLFQKHL